MLKELIKIASELDKSGFSNEANSIDQMIKVLASNECKYEKEYFRIIEVFTRAFSDHEIRVGESSFCFGDEIDIIFDMKHKINLKDSSSIRCFQDVRIRVNGPMKGNDTILYSVSSSLNFYGKKSNDSFLVKKNHTATEKENIFQSGKVAIAMKNIVFQMIKEQTKDFEKFINKQYIG